MRILLCDDHTLFADALATVLSAAGHEVVGVAGTPESGVAMVMQDTVDVCIMDLHFPTGSGVLAIRRVVDGSPGTRVLVLTGTSSEPDLAAAVQAGAHAVVIKDDNVQAMIDAVDMVRKAKASEPAVVQRPLPCVTSRLSEDRLARFLTRREWEVLEHLVRGETTADLAEILGVHYSTARTHVQNLLTKLGVHSRIEAVAYAVTNRLVPVPDGQLTRSRS